MPTFSGKMQYLNPAGSALQAGPCRVSFEQETLTVTPSSGAPLALDLGDIDRFVPGDYELSLTLYTGGKIVLNQFGKTFQTLSHDLLEAYRKRLLQCLLLEDLEEVARFDGFAQLESPARVLSSPAEFRLFKSNLAILPTQATGLQWRLADIGSVTFDEANWTIAMESDGQRLAVSKLARRTEEFRERLETAIQEVAERGAGIVHDLFPFLDPDQSQQMGALMKEGRAAPAGKLRTVHPKADQALATNVVDDRLKPYFDVLKAHTPVGNYYAGFKLLREDEQDSPEKTQDEGSADADSTDQIDDAAAESGEATEEQPVLHWFFFPLASQPGAKYPGNLVAWEATSRSGRATYFFRLVEPRAVAQLQDGAKSAGIVEAAIRQLNRAIVLLNFRREPIYLAYELLLLQPRFRRYAIACRKLPELVRLRGSFLGRAIHTSPAAWRKQFESFLAQA
jgi:hypothetical protein